MSRHHKNAHGLDLSIVVPLFNESGTFEELHRRLTAVLLVLGLDHEIIYVDDGSTDGTGEVLRVLAARDPRVRAINLARNFGQTAALAAGSTLSKIPAADKAGSLFLLAIIAGIVVPSALMAALGARRKQIVGAVLVEATLVGSVASVVGLGLGIGVSALLKSVMEANSGAQLPVGLIVPIGDLVLAFVLGVAVTLVAALLPAIRASNVPPVEAMRASAAEQRSLARITVFGAVPAVLT